MSITIPYLCAALLAVAIPAPCPSLSCRCEAAYMTALSNGPMDPCVDGDLVAALATSVPNWGHAINEFTGRAMPPWF